MSGQQALGVCILIGSVVMSGCAYRHYMGLHGPTIQRLPDKHASVSEDYQCLSCHHPDRDPIGPPTSHPGFKGCLKCHNDPLRP